MILLIVACVLFLVVGYCFTVCAKNAPDAGDPIKFFGAGIPGCICLVIAIIIVGNFFADRAELSPGEYRDLEKLVDSDKRLQDTVEQFLVEDEKITRAEYREIVRKRGELDQIEIIERLRNRKE